ncbi:MAG: bifunctional DNA-formamidopyrimidine glycosylase/DNA-(apurinic or apyrimidinic site) lyase [Candidatus Daviesbacteria bacterium]|nr:MAG: bifunctional DNA-formamidopyrimidine glycosylase/DNA-(apurinic or apyrimidinic site) lyase [Candidatus Daviesbacteria bacterium]
MPELPEVETIRLGLSKKIIGLKITKIQLLSPKSFLGNPNLAEGKKVLKIVRFAKMLGIELSGDLTLLFHLKMTGQLIYDDGNRLIGGHPTPDMRDSMPNAHTRVVFSFSDDRSYVSPKAKLKVPATAGFLYFNDQRRFGWVKVIPSVILSEAKDLKNLGPEPLQKEFTWEILKQNLLRHKSQPVKVAIMDQSVISGVGNIYASEACFEAKLDPRKKVKDLTEEEFKSLHQGIITALQNGIKHGGSSRAHFVDPEGKRGYYLDFAKVYMKEGRKCPRCGGVVTKITQAGRGTYFCPKCQK